MKSHYWSVHFPDREPVERKYQEPVAVERVLGEHHAALAAVPVGSARTSAPLGDIKRTDERTGEFRCS